MTFVMLAIGRSMFRPRLQSRAPVAASTGSAPLACTRLGASALSVASRTTVAGRAPAAAVADGAGKIKAAATIATATELTVRRRCGRTGDSGSTGAGAGRADRNTAPPGDPVRVPQPVGSAPGTGSAARPRSPRPRPHRPPAPPPPAPGTPPTQSQT